MPGLFLLLMYNYLGFFKVLIFKVLFCIILGTNLWKFLINEQKAFL